MIFLKKEFVVVVGMWMAGKTSVRSRLFFSLFTGVAQSSAGIVEYNFLKRRV